MSVAEGAAAYWFWVSGSFTLRVQLSKRSVPPNLYQCATCSSADHRIDVGSDTCREHAIGTTVQRRRWRLISHIATLSFPALTISSPIVLSSDPGFCSFVPRILSSQSYILARYLLLFAPLFVMVQDAHSGVSSRYFSCSFFARFSQPCHPHTRSPLS